jgi:hypothetical protein
VSFITGPTPLSGETEIQKGGQKKKRTELRTRKRNQEGHEKEILDQIKKDAKNKS